MIFLLEPINEAGQLVTAVEYRETVETAVELMQALDHEEIAAFARQTLDHLDDLLAPLLWLELGLVSWRWTPRPNL